MSDQAIQTQEIAEIAARFIDNTSKNIFLTGKAGTGKTTFLHAIAKSTYKRHIIVAPTGIAALNAGGVTIHSQFLLPLGSFLASANLATNVEHGQFYDTQQLLIRHPLNAARAQVLREIDLLIVDEVSMLRADLLDAIDFRLRMVRRNSNPFGGVQLLLIGDLLQLPPIVEESHWNVLKSTYEVPHFFAAGALKKAGYVYVELDKVFRQIDDRFIRLLNNLRNNNCDQSDLDLLNSFYNNTDKLESGVITLTSHNYQADKINTQQLESLPGKSFDFIPQISGDFPASSYPLPSKSTFKVGAQVMFIKNDTQSKQFYNGKLAEIISLSPSEIQVKFFDDDRVLKLTPMIWRNVKYIMTENKALVEDEVGTFTAYPIKLAWAITVHKSQGLTFEKAAIDVGKAFAPGQVYVALSRLKSLDGLRLYSRISLGAIQADIDAQRFQAEHTQQAPLPDLLRKAQTTYLIEVMQSTFDFAQILRTLKHVREKAALKIIFEDAHMNRVLPAMNEAFDSERMNTVKFAGQLKILLEQNQQDNLLNRIEKGAIYYENFCYAQLYQVMLHIAEVATFSKTKSYITALEELEQAILRKVADLQRSIVLVKSTFLGVKVEGLNELAKKRNEVRTSYAAKIEELIERNPKSNRTKSGRVSKAKKGRKKGDTFEETYGLLEKGNSIDEVAKLRELTKGTIESHVSRGIATKRLQVEDHVDERVLNEVKSFFKEKNSYQLGEAFAHFKGKHSYGLLRMISASIASESVEN